MNAGNKKRKQRALRAAADTPNNATAAPRLDWSDIRGMDAATVTSTAAAVGVSLDAGHLTARKSQLWAAIKAARTAAAA